LESELFTIGIVSYNNYRYITEAVDSILAQTYPRIELLISNDASPDFNEEELRSYIDSRKGPNIVRVEINNNRENVGTVKNVNGILRRAEGKYLMFLAADDALYDENVLSAYAECFRKNGKQAYVVSSKTAMCSHDLQEIVSYYPDEEGIDAIQDDTPLQLFSRQTHTFTIPTTSTCYRREIYDELGLYDEDYQLIEDAPFFLRFSRLGYRVFWINGMTGARHRDGGISHGNTMRLSKSFQKYRTDEIRCYEKEIKPYLKQVLPADIKKTKAKWKYVLEVYDRDYIRPTLTPKQLFVRRVKHLPIIFGRMLQRFLRRFYELLMNRDLERAFTILLVLNAVEVLGAVATAYFGLKFAACLIVFARVAFRTAVVSGVVLLAMAVTKVLTYLYGWLRFTISAK